MNIWFALLGMSSFFASLVIAYLEYRLRVRELLTREERVREQMQFNLQQILLGAMSPEARDEWLVKVASASIDNLPDNNNDGTD